MTFLSYNEYLELGFDVTDRFDELYKRAEMTINLYIRNFYAYREFDSDFEPRKQAVKLATAYQVAYLDASGIMTADDKQSVSSVSLGRTSVSYKSSSKTSLENARYNLSLDALNALEGEGFGYRGVSYDRY
nr:MAG TPA: putative Head Tail Connector Protein [Caudoviricetes sp.]